MGFFVSVPLLNHSVFLHPKEVQTGYRKPKRFLASEFVVSLLFTERCIVVVHLVELSNES